MLLEIEHLRLPLDEPNAASSGAPVAAPLSRGTCVAQLDEDDDFDDFDDDDFDDEFDDDFDEDFDDEDDEDDEDFEDDVDDI